MERSDEELARSAARGSVEAAQVLFARHWDEVRRIAHMVCGRASLGDEVAQEAAVEAFARIDRFRADGPFGAWLRRIVVTRGLNALRSERRLTVLDDAPGLAAGEAVAADPLLMRAVDSLPSAQRVVVVLRFGLDLSPSEIAQALDLPVGTVGSRLARALDTLREHYEVGDVERA